MTKLSEASLVVVEGRREEVQLRPALENLDRAQRTT